MKIKVAILDEDENYVRRIINTFSYMFANEIEVYLFTEQETAMRALVDGIVKIDILLAGREFDIDVNKIPKSCGFAYFVETQQIDNMRGQKTICKFQKAELIYKEILALYADSSEIVLKGTHCEGKEARVLSFLSASGGTGSSSAAAACAKRLAKTDNNVLYLNLEKFGSVDDFFAAEGSFNLSDVIFAIKSNKNNLSMKLESTVKHDASGVFFFSSCQTAFDVMELSPNDINRLLEALKALGKYDYIVVDMDFNFEKCEIEILKSSFRIIFVSSGTAVANTKLGKALDALLVFERQNELKLMQRINLLYNNFRSKTGQTLERPDIKVLGGLSRFDGADTHQVVEEISKREVFESLWSM